MANIPPFATLNQIALRREFPGVSVSGIAYKEGLQRATEFTEASYLDLSAPTDARPFFFNQLRLDRLFDQDVFALASRPGVYGGNLSATITLAILIFIAAVFVVTTIVAPLGATVSRTEPVLAATGAAYFALIGIGFMMVEIALLQRISVFLGHPVYALSVVLFSLILSTGIGSLASERIPLDDRPKLMAWSALVGLYLLALPFWLPDVLSNLGGRRLEGCAYSSQPWSSAPPLLRHAEASASTACFAKQAVPAATNGLQPNLQNRLYR